LSNKVLASLILTSGLLNYIYNISQYSEFLTAAAISTAVSVVFCLFKVKGATKYISIVLFLLGISLLVSSGAEINIWYQAFNKNGSLLAILIIVPMIGIIFKYPYYLSAIEETVRRSLNSKHRLYILLFIITHILSVPLNFTSIPICGQLVVRNFDREEKRTALNAIARGYSSILYWSPNTGAMALVLQWGAHWSEDDPLVFTMCRKGRDIFYMLYKVRENIFC